MSDPAQTVVFRSLRGRYLLLSLAFSMMAPVAFLYFFVPAWAESTGTIYDGLDYVTSYLFIGLFLYWGLWRKGLSRHFTFGPRATKKGIIVYALFAIPMLAIAVVAVYLLFLPLSYSQPDFVQEWILDQPALLVWKIDTSAIIANAMIILAVTVLAPVLEETLFRGFLLNRWCDKYGNTTAIILSSALFGILHADLLGAFVFGVVLAVVYLRTNSLIGPIIIHVANNVIALTVEAVFLFIYGPDDKWTMEQFQSEWYYPVIGAFIAVPWLIWFWKNPGKFSQYNRS